MSEVAVVTLTTENARKLTERIRYTALSVRDGMEKLQRLVQEAKDGNAHEALGYVSWQAYLSDTLGAEPLRLPRDQRQELVAYLSREDMSTRAIAPIIGADHSTVVRDLQVVHGAPPVPEPDVIVDHDTGEILDTPEPRKVTGLDGKAYSLPEPKATRTPPRRALTDQFFDAAFDMGKAIERVHRLTEDDRWNQNAEKVAAKHRSDLLRLNDLLAEVIDRLA